MQMKVGANQFHWINGINKKVLVSFWNIIFYRTKEHHKKKHKEKLDPLKIENKN